MADSNGNGVQRLIDKYPYTTGYLVFAVTVLMILQFIDLFRSL